MTELLGIVDRRRRSDRYLSLEADRARAIALREASIYTNYHQLTNIYYHLATDSQGRGPRFARHVAGAEARGGAIAELLPRGGRTLELGCGSGGLLAAAARLGMAIEGVDIASRWLVIAERRLEDAGLSVPLTAADACDLPHPDASFDTVVADSLLEHLDEPRRAIAEAARVLRPGGLLVLWSPNRYTLLTDPHVHLWGLGFLPRKAALRYAALRRPGMHAVSPLSAREASRLVESSGFRDVTVEPAPLHAARQAGRWAFAGASYARLLRSPFGSRFLLACGPVWQLTAIRTDAPHKGARA